MVSSSVRIVAGEATRQVSAGRPKPIRGYEVRGKTDGGTRLRYIANDGVHE